jgi:hypothetical protein
VSAEVFHIFIHQVERLSYDRVIQSLMICYDSFPVLFWKKSRLFANTCFGDAAIGASMVAKLLTWAGFAVEGHSREDALWKLDQQVKAQLAGGEIAYLDLPLAPSENPWLAIAGKYQDDPNWDEYQAAIAEARQTANEIEGIWLEGDADK